MQNVLVPAQLELRDINNLANQAQLVAASQVTRWTPNQADMMMDLWRKQVINCFNTLVE